MKFKKITACSLLAFFVAGCATSKNDSIFAKKLQVEITHTGPEIDTPHQRVNRVTNSSQISVGKQPTTLTLPPAGGVTCSSKDECRQFVQDAVFTVHASNADEANVSWNVFTGREVVIDLEMGNNKHYFKRSISPSIASVSDSRKVIESNVKIGETKKLIGPYGSEVTISVTRAQQ